MTGQPYSTSTQGEGPQGASLEPSLDLLGLLTGIWNRKWLIIAAGLVFGAAGAAYALLAQEWYRADAVLMPVDSKPNISGLAGNLGGLANLAGLNLGSSGTQEPVAVLRSRDFARDFILQNGLIAEMRSTPLFGGARRKAPDIREAVEFFDGKVRRVTEDKRTGLVTLSIEWKSSDVAAKWANALVANLNERMRKQAETDAAKNVAFLQKAMAETGVVPMQQSLGRLLESEMQKLMLARGNDEFAFRPVDRAYPPIRRSRPKRTATVVLAGIVGGLLASFAVLIETAARRGVFASGRQWPAI